MNKDRKGAFETNFTYIHNTKIVTSDVQQEKKKKDKKTLMSSCRKMHFSHKNDACNA